MVADGRLGIVPATAAAPVMGELRQYKAEIIGLLESARIPAMPAGVRLVRWAPKDAPVRLSECSIITDTEKFICTTLWQLEARLHGKDWRAGNWTLSTLIDRLAAVGCHVALEDERSALQ